jgi:hypothetical protein
MSARVQPSKSKGKAPQARDKLLARVLAAPDGPSMLALIRERGESRLTAVDAVTPPGSFLSVVISEVRERTDLPPEIALGVVMSQMAGALTQGGCTVSWPGDSRPVQMAMWMVVLAPSGAGKTLLRSLVDEALGLDVKNLPEPGSARAFLSGLQECNGTAIWVRDEYGQLIKQIADGGPLGPLRDYMLRAYDHAPLEVTTQKDGLTKIEHPVLSIFASTVDSTWAGCIDAAMLADGLLARHLFIVAQRRPLSVPRYPTREMSEAISSAAVGLRERLHERVDYVITEEAASVYDTLWRKTAGVLNGKIDPAYFRRVTWSTSRYAVLYHLLLGEPGREIGPHAMQWAWRMTLLHLQYVREVLNLSDVGFAGKVEKILSWVEMRIGQGTDPTSNAFIRELIQHFRRDLSNASEARQLIDLARKSAKSG